MKNNFKTLSEGITASFREYSERPCLDVGGISYTYSEIAETSFWIANVIKEISETEDRFVAFLAYRSMTAYAAVYGTLISGKAYVPLNPRFPVSRNVKSIVLSGSRIIILGEECTETFSACAGDLGSSTIICPSPTEKLRELAGKFPQHKFVFISEGSVGKSHYFKNPDPEDPAYLLFTSGSTGVPKGVLVSHLNVCEYAKYNIDHYKISPEDRFSQLPDLTFDLSVHDLFISVLAGACLCVAPEKSLMAPAKFVKEKEITFWTSVPSVILFMSQMRMLKPDSYPTIRCSMFCGEALPEKSAALWQLAAPNSIIENTYGPTEATVAITNYRWNSQTSPAECLNGIVPIGFPFPGQKIRLINENGEKKVIGEEGELCLGGSQVSLGYFNDPERTGEQFVYFEDEPGMRWYKTGDLVKQDSDGCLYYLGRIDEQVKIRGYRVELQEIDRILRQASGTENAVAVPSNLNQGTTAKIFGFVMAEEDGDLAKKILEHCNMYLPAYMVPSQIKFVKNIPINTNGKIDRKALL